MAKPYFDANGVHKMTKAEVKEAEVTTKALKFLDARDGQWVPVGEIADALGVTHRYVNAILNGVGQGSRRVEVRAGKAHGTLYETEYRYKPTLSEYPRKRKATAGK